jgi:hypothetical protein
MSRFEGSNPSLSATHGVSVPDTWVTVHTGDIGNTFRPKGLSGFQPASLVVEVSQIVVYEAGRPGDLPLFLETAIDLSLEMAND